MGKHTKKQTVFDRYNKIVIDTSSLMEFETLRMFLVKNSDAIRDSGRQILIPESVQMEIARHIDSGKLDKVEKSLACISVLAEYPDLIVCNNCGIPEDLKYSTHADREILAMLISGKSQYRQLLITNDYDLAMDALALNSQRSCPGETISVRRINKNGELKSFKVKKQPGVSTAPMSSAVYVIPDIDNMDTSQLAASGQGLDHAQDPTMNTTSATSEKSCLESAPASISMPRFILGIIGAGLVGAIFGAAAVKASEEDFRHAA